jgi:hypothetical protein
MSATTTKSKRSTRRNQDLQDLLVNFNLLCASVDGIAAKLDADAGVTDTTYGSLWTTQYAKIGRAQDGTAITAANA